MTNSNQRIINGILYRIALNEDKTIFFIRDNNFNVQLINVATGATIGGNTVFPREIVNTLLG